MSMEPKISSFKALTEKKNFKAPLNTFCAYYLNEAWSAYFSGLIIINPHTIQE